MPYEKETSLQEEIRNLLQAQENTDTEQQTKEVTPQVDQETPASEVTSEPQDYQPKDEWEEKALKIGWNPNKTGDNAVDAKEYVLRKPLFERIEKQSKELREVKEKQRQADTYLAQVRKEAYDQALRELEAKRDLAIDEANSFEARKLDGQVKQLNRQMAADPIVNVPAYQQIDPELQAFGQRAAAWYNEQTPENTKMKAAAEAVDVFLYKQAKIDQGLDLNNLNQVPIIDVRNHTAQIEAEVKRLFPHRFEQQRGHTAPVQMVGKSTAPVRENKSMSNLASRLTPQQKQLGERFNRDNPTYTLEKYAQELEQMGRLGK